MRIAPAKTSSVSTPISTALIARAHSSTRRGDSRSTTAPPISMKAARGSAIAASTRPSAAGLPVSVITCHEKATSVNWSPSAEIALPANSRRKSRWASGEAWGVVEDMGDSVGSMRCAGGSARLGLRIAGDRGKAAGVLAHVLRPTAGMAVESVAVAAPQRARGFLVTGEVARDHAHEAIGGFAGEAGAVLRAAVAAGILHQLAQGDRGAAGLAVEPVPVARQQGHLARHHAEAGAAGAARHIGARGRPQAREHLVRAAAEVDFHRLAGGVVEDQRRARGVLVEQALHRRRHLGERTGGDQRVAVEGGAAGAVVRGHGAIRVWPAAYFARVKCVVNTPRAKYAPVHTVTAALNARRRP